MNILSRQPSRRHGERKMWDPLEIMGIISHRDRFTSVSATTIQLRTIIIMKFALHSFNIYQLNAIFSEARRAIEFVVVRETAQLLALHWRPIPRTPQNTCISAVLLLQNNWKHCSAIEIIHQLTTRHRQAPPFLNNVNTRIGNPFEHYVLSCNKRTLVCIDKCSLGDRLTGSRGSRWWNGDSNLIESPLTIDTV